VDPARLIPAIERLRRRPAAQRLEREFGPDALVEALRHEATALRTALRDTEADGPAPDVATEDDAAVWIETRASARLASTRRSRLTRVINATGVVLHTNLGRAPLSPVALDRVRDVAAGYSSLELDLGTGRRGRRDVHAESLLCGLTGAEAAVVVNNNAAAALLALTALARGREVLVSRGELVEIGGGFRIPDILRQSGATLREVGATNRTRAADYAAAIGPNTALILRVHPSNFAMTGFTAKPSLSELASLARTHALPLVEDLGSGWLDRRVLAELDEPDVASSLRAGVDLVTFSGDKLLGGPQAGLIVGRLDLVDSIRQHPLMRAVRVDKMTYAALEATLEEYARGRAREAIPIVRMLAVPIAVLEARAQRIADAAASAGWYAEVVSGESAIGGGSAPAARLATRLVALKHASHSADELLARLRELSPPVVARIENDRIVVDLRTVEPDDDGYLEERLVSLSGVASLAPAPRKSSD
jgi:L-seryl-tRNA(Ser) seleniumtransferase